jgi:hypothetical protein
VLTGSGERPVLRVALPQVDRAPGSKQPRLIREGDAMSFGLYAIGLAIAIAGGFFYWREGSPEVLTAVFV